MPQTYIWIHEDALSQDHPVFDAAGFDANEDNVRAVFIWDSAYFERQAYSLKRLTFIYECLIDLQAQAQETGQEQGLAAIDVYRGDTETVLRSLCIGKGLKTGEDAPLYMADTPNPDFRLIAENLAQDLSVEIIKNPPFIDAPDDVDMTRFFRFWNRSRRSAFGFETPS